MTTPKIDALILTALPVEYAAVRHHLSHIQELVHPEGTIYEYGAIERLTIAIAEVGPGNASAALEAERGIAHLRPRTVVFVGVAGGIKDVQLGDIVVASRVHGYESGKDATSFHPRPSSGEPSYSLNQRAAAEARKTDWRARLPTHRTPKVLVRPIAAGEKVVASTRSATHKFLRTQYGDAVAVEMEGRGFLAATRANESVNALIVRGISDLINRKAGADASGSQQFASEHAAAFAIQVLVEAHRPTAPTVSQIRAPVLLTSA